MAAATKIAAFGALLRVLVVAAPQLHAQWRPLVWAVAIASMAVGAIAAVAQNNVKRMLAYSAIAHAGFVLTGVAAGRDGVAAALFYLFAYGIGTVAAFALAGLVRRPDGSEADRLADWTGLGRRRPAPALVMAVLLLSFAGIPLTAGFVAKFDVFSAAASAGAAPLVVVAVIASAVAAYFYIRVIVAMFFAQPLPTPAALTPDVIVPGVIARTTIAAAAVVTLVLGVYPQPLLDVARHAASFATS
jgi:NADH-quinone oxidoreductase subunit N